ncbi:uncharacterized protein [Eurosta solidaginis]|uniref:uncharacterized protein n=1 Tax=Eurosta solidaginis TaxID=178769 RepID=UPI0035310A4A
MLIILMAVPGFIAGLKDVSVTIPQAVKRGSNALLICNYDMENDTLYSVKWYKGRREFYRYTPKENPAMKVFPMAAAGLNVERNLSNQSHVVLLAVPLNISGKFTCEISVEAPTFQTAMVSGELEVVELPEEQAIVTGIQPRYRIGDLVDGNCSIKYSKPAANLTWTINGIVVPLHHIKTYETERYEENNLESVVSALHFMVTTQHFIKGQMRLKCTASIFDIFKEEIESVIEEDRPRIMASGRSYDMHNNYPYEQHASGDGFEDHNESFLTYSAADITSSATTVHTNTYTKTLKMRWKQIWTSLTASMAAIRIFSKQFKQPVVEELELKSVKRITEARYNEEEGKIAKALGSFEVKKESVAYIFAILFTTIFVRVLTRHFISCQKMSKKSTTMEREHSTLRRAFATELTRNMLAPKVIRATTAAATKSTTTSTVIVKRAVKARKSFHNCIENNLKSLIVLLVCLLHTLLKMFMQYAISTVNPLQKLQLLQEQEQQEKEHHQSTAIKQRAETHLQCNANEQLSLTVADGSSTPPLPIRTTTTTTSDVLTFDTVGASATKHAALDICSSNITCETSSSSSNYQAIANFTKDTSKDQKLLMMIAQGFDCQHADDFVTLTQWSKYTRKKHKQIFSLQSIKNDELQTKVLTFYWQKNAISPSFFCCNC